MNHLPKRTNARIAGRRAVNALLLAVCLFLLAVWVSRLETSLVRSSFLTGYVLWLSLIFLTLFNLRKKLTMLPKLGSAAFWMQAHIYVGLGTFAVFGLHVGWRFPTGGFDRILAALYWFVALSGIYGLYLTRTVPRRLTQIRVEPIFEAIPRLRYQLLQKATAIMDEQFENNEVLRPVYYRKLRPFFENDRGPWYMLFPSARKSRALVAEIQKQHRYLSPADRRASSALAQLVRECDDLDYHRAMQGRLKVWLIVHVSCTYSLLIVATWHGVMAHAFSGVLR